MYAYNRIAKSNGKTLIRWGLAVISRKPRSGWIKRRQINYYFILDVLDRVRSWSFIYVEKLCAPNNMYIYLCICMTHSWFIGVKKSIIETKFSLRARVDLSHWWCSMDGRYHKSDGFNEIGLHWHITREIISALRSFESSFPRLVIKQVERFKST